MKTVQIGKRKLEIYDSIDELPIKRFHKFNKYILVDSGVGSDISDIYEHINRVKAYVNKDDKENAIKQLNNLTQCLYMVSQETNIKHLSFMVLIKSIDGKEIYDISDENLKRLLKMFGNEPTSFLNKLYDFVKKKIDSELILYFPSQFDDPSVKDYYDRMRLRTLLKLDVILRGNDNALKIQEIDDFLLTLAKPGIFSGKDSTEIQYEKQFEEMCLFLSKELSVNSAEMTVLQFYNSFNYIKRNKPKRNKNVQQPKKV